MELSSSNGTIVYVDDLTINKLQAHPDVLEFLSEAISKLEISENSEHLKVNVDLGRVIGKSGLIETPEIQLETKTYFAYRKNRKYPSHISKQRDGTESQTVAITIKKILNKWKLITAYIGLNTPSEPFYYFDKDSWYYKDEKQLQESLDFWTKHAIAYDENTTGDIYESTWTDEIDRIKKLD